MEREEAINLIKQVLPCLNIDEKIREGFVTLIPELKESEDERIRKDIIALIKFGLNDGSAVSPGSHTTKEEALAYLEKQKEQKPAIYDDEKPLLAKFENLVYSCVWEKVTCKPEGETKEEYAERWAKSLLVEVRDWADDYIDSQIELAERKAYDKGKSDAEKSAAWSEEDERTLESFLGWLQGSMGEKTYSSWLKSLPERFRPQPKQEWSEEEKMHLYNAIEAVKYVYDTSEGTNGFKCVEFLKSLRSYWKPSKGQIEALEYFIRSWGESGTMSPQNPILCAAKSLLKDLKKL